MRILYLINSLNTSGGARRTFEICNRLSDRGHEMTIATACDLAPQHLGWFPLLDSVRVCPGSLPHESFDGAICTVVEQTLHFASQTKARVRYVYAEGLVGDYEEVSPKVRQFVEANRLAANSPYSYRALSAKFPTLRIEKWFGGINLDQFRRIQPLWARKNTSVLCVGRWFLPWKGLSDALEAFRIAYHARNDIELHLALPRDSHPRSKPAPEDTAGLPLYIHEGLSQLDLVRFYSSGDVLLAADHWAGWHNAVFEALACGTAVIAADIPAFEGIFPDGKGPLKAKVQNPQDMAEKLLTFLDNPELGRPMVAEARKCLWDYRWEAVIDRIEQSLKESAQEVV